MTNCPQMVVGTERLLRRSCRPVTHQFFSPLQSYKLAVELKPDQSQAWMNMGGIQHIKVTGVHHFHILLLVEVSGQKSTRVFIKTRQTCVQGDYAAARMFYQRALLLSPGSKLLKENLAKLDRLERKLSRGS